MMVRIVQLLKKNIKNGLAMEAAYLWKPSIHEKSTYLWKRTIHETQTATHHL